MSFISPQLTDAVDACGVREDEFSNCIKKNVAQTPSIEALSRCKAKGYKRLVFKEIFTVFEG